MSLAQTATNFKISADQLIGDDDSAEEFVCKICLVHVAGCGPQLTKCSHLFCGDCLQQWFDTHPSNQTWAQRAQTAGAVPCPVCKTLLRKESDVYPVEKNGSRNSAFLWQMLQGLKIKCSDGCCTWIGDCGSYLDHLQCGKCGEVETCELDSLQKDVAACGWDHSNVRPPSPSTCSGISEEHDAEALNTYSSVGDSIVEEESEVETLPAPEASHPEESTGHDLTSLVNDLIQLEANTPINHTEDEPLAKPDEEPTKRSPKESKSNKGKKNKQQKAKADTSSRAKSSNMCLTAEEVQAHQWQAARYQMACAQQYHMAVQAFRMQQYYQQMRMVVGGSI